MGDGGRREGARAQTSCGPNGNYEPFADSKHIVYSIYSYSNLPHAVPLTRFQSVISRKPLSDSEVRLDSKTQIFQYKMRLNFTNQPRFINCSTSLVTLNWNT